MKKHWINWLTLVKMDEYILQLKTELVELKRKYPDWKVNPRYEIEMKIEKLRTLISSIPKKDRSKIPNVLPPPKEEPSVEHHCKCCRYR